MSSINPVVFLGAGLALTVFWFYLAHWVWPPHKASRWQVIVIVLLGLLAIGLTMASNLSTTEPTRKECNVQD